MCEKQDELIKTDETVPGASSNTVSVTFTVSISLTKIWNSRTSVELLRSADEDGFCQRVSVLSSPHIGWRITYGAGLYGPDRQKK